MFKLELEKKIDDLFISDKKFVSLLDKAKKKFWFNIFFMIGMIALLIIGTIVIIISSISDGYVGQEFNKSIYIGIVIFIIGILTGIGAIFFNFASPSQRNITRSISEYQFDNNKTKDIYNYYFSLININNVNKSKGIEFEFNSKFMQFKYDDKKLFRFKKIGTQEQTQPNSLFFTIKDHKLKFTIFHPVEIIVKTNNSQGKTETKTYYLSEDELVYENTKFDSTFDGIKITKGKMLNKNFQTESILFNKMYNVNTKPNDIRGPMFLSPKLIDKLTTIKQKDFKEFGIDKDFYVTKSRYLEGKYDLSIALLNYTWIKSYKGFKKNFVKKVIRDFELLESSIQFIEEIY
ncbi:hypothetical protein SCORR_v1c04500 [Spiroplasma corruscae]|uniref:DUF3137 domain-containing protein n=1 Tax=Spiroplasma corruscae TaxID=216934 RepID=A0A222EP18_9MOLU|nr:hypothetical protein [Spiroplasma corruscae]ASP28222.1 hypothetical protein SCORR_v1c04500 [Spiroplasma corruscae]